MPDAKKPARKSAKKKTSKAAAQAQMKQLDQALRQAFEMFGGEHLTREDLKALKASLTGPSADEGLSEAEADAKDEAQQIAFEAMDAPTAAEARRLAKRALKLDPDCVDALLVITDLDARTERERLEGLQRAVAAGERSLGAKFIDENEGHFWLLIETRPYMRALELMAEAYRSHDIRCDAIKVYEKMLKLNPNDNQGVRDPLLGLYLETGDLNAAALILSRYKDDASASFAWARVLERFLAGERAGASAALKRARRANRHVELILTGRTALPDERPEMYSPGSEEEAALCVSYLSGALAEHKEAAMWLYDQLKKDGLGLAPTRAALRKVRAAKTIQ